LVVDDDPEIREAVRRALRLEGLQVDLAEGGQDALDQLKAVAPDAVVLDLMMPPPDGLEVCRRLRAAGDQTPVIVLTARDAVSDRVAGLDAGADDYLIKPFAMAELLARLRAALRRRDAPAGGPLRFAGLALDPGTREVNRDGCSLQLTRLEFALLELFLCHPCQVLTRDVILDRVWGYVSDSTAASLEVYVGRLRRKLEQAAEARLIHTVRGVGYVLREP